MPSRRQYRNCLKSIQNLNSKQLISIACTVIIIWLCLLLYICSRPKPNDEQMKEEILELSRRYVYALSKEQMNDVDGPYSGRLTGYDLKKTFAVLLQNVLERLTVLERSVSNLTKSDVASVYSNLSKNDRIRSGSVNLTLRNPLNSHNKIDFKDLITGAQETCALDLESKLKYPECDDKVEWMKKHWRSHKCYTDNGVDGSYCSIVIYLSEVESFCPRLHFREQNLSVNMTDTKVTAELNFNLTMLLDKLERLPGHDTYRFMKLRIQRIWPNMVEAVKKLNQTASFQQRSMKTIVVYLGYLSTASKLKISENIFKGGPLGELVQWTDLIMGLHILGHDVTIFNELDDIKNYFSTVPNLNVPCQTKLGMRLDLLFTDIIGFNQIQLKLLKFKCILRILDSFGTQASFNNPFYLNKLKVKKNGWMGKLLELKQFYNMFPHTSDNSFLGFIIETPKNLIFPRQKIALVYGKHVSMWKDSQKYLNIMKNYFKIHATVNEGGSVVPSYVTNHGILLGSNYSDLLGQSMVFIGLGFPYEGPAPLEAIAHGAIFMNVRLANSRMDEVNNFFKDKPTKRNLNSQHPYVATSIGKPYSYLVDMDNEHSIRQVCQEIIDNPVTESFVPYEFTEAGFIQRLAILIEKHNFCHSPGHFDEFDSSDDNLWPSLQSSHFFLGVINQSCDETCHKQGLICESSYIERMMNNRLELQQRGVWCENVRFDGHPAYPSYEPYQKTCYFQTDHFLFSCSDSLSNHMRFCGCRDFVVGQSAICKTCL